MSRRFPSRPFVLRQLELDFTKHEFAGQVLPGRIQNRLWLFPSLLCRRVSTKKSTFQDIFACISAVWLSVYSKIHESCKSEVKPQIKVVIVQQSAVLRARFTIFTSRASQFRSRPFLNRCGFAVYTTSKPYRFENAPLLKAYSKRHGSDNEFGRRRVNERRNRIESDAVTNETASV